MTTLRTPTFKGKKAVIVLSWLALVFTVLGSIPLTAETDVGGWRYYHYLAVTGLVEDVVFAIIPCILLALYITWFHEKAKADFLLPIVFGLLTLHAIDSVNFEVLSLDRGDYYVDEFYLVSAFCWLVATIVTLFKQYNKVIMTIITTICLAVEAYPMVIIANTIFERHSDQSYLNDGIRVSGAIGTLLFYAALIIFVLMAYKKEMKEEYELRILQTQLASGKITEEEYQAKRADIIRRL